MVGKISRSTIVNNPDFLMRWYTLLALGDPGITLENGRVRIVGAEIATNVAGTDTNGAGLAYLFNKMNLRYNKPRVFTTCGNHPGQRSGDSWGDQ